MKLAFLLILSLTSLSTFAKSDPCYEAITNIMKVVASETSKVLDMKVVVDTKSFSLVRGEGKDERTYMVKLDNGYTNEYWYVDVLVSDLISPKYMCKVNKFESRLN